MFSIAFDWDNTIYVEEEKYTIDLSFDNIIRFLEMLDDNSLTEIEKVLLGINMLLKVSFLFNMNYTTEILLYIIDKYIRQESKEAEKDLQGNAIPFKNEEEVYSLIYDAEYIYASFYQAYGIDLIAEKGKLHWLNFRALLNGLPDNTIFKQIVDIRTRKLPKTATSDEKRDIGRLKRKYALPNNKKKVGDTNG